MKETLFYEKLEKRNARCEVCAHHCFVSEGKIGVCGIRQNIGGKLYLLNYGKAVAVQVDPVEKKPLFHFLPGANVFSLGTLGCNFRCLNCQNYDISQMFDKKRQEQDYNTISWGQDLSPKEIIRLAKEYNCQAVAYTYNEPTVWLEYALDIMKLARENNLKNIWVSNGYMSEKTRQAISPYLDAINIDIKSFDSDFYHRISGADLEPVLENCRYFSQQKNIWLEVTTLIIPTLSDQEEMLKALAKFIKKDLGKEVPWHVSAFSGQISWRLKHLPDTPAEKINKAYEIGKQTGLNYVYAGNLWLKGKENTYCPKCGELVIERLGYEIVRFDKKGKCPKCSFKLPGVW